MRVDNLNVAGVAWSNFEPGININGSVAIVYSLLVDPVNMGAGVNVAVVMLSGRGKEGGRGGGGGDKSAK
jgi:hypothetical protein